MEKRSMEIRQGDIIKFKKKHPCGSFEWKVLRSGTDLRLECCGCGHQVEMPRPKAVKNLKEIRHCNKNSDKS